MVTLEQVRLLESKVGKALSYVESLSAENTTLREKLDGYRRRIDELETIVLAFKEDQGRIEAGILSALERLNQFEDAVERGIDDARETAPAPESIPIAKATHAIEEVAESSEEPEASDLGLADESAPDATEKTGELDIF
jgi:chromosome segregation ATPase